MKTGQAKSHEDNLHGCNNSPQKLLHDGLQPSIASAKDFAHPYKSQSTSSSDLLLNQNICTDSSGYRTYLCDYQYKGEKWSIELKASSFEDAKGRLKALTQGVVVGELKFSIPVPTQEKLLAKIKKWFSL